MFLKTALLLLSFTLSQVSATTLLQKRSFQFLESRQTTCTATCNALSNVLSSCTTVSCVCNSGVVASLQACINCAVTTSPTAAVIAEAQQLKTTYESTCAGVAVPTVTIPGTGSTGSIVTGTTDVSIALPSSSLVVSHVTVSDGSPTPAVVKNTVTGLTSTTDDGTSPTATSGSGSSGVPGVVKSEGRRDALLQGLLVVFGAFVGAALVL